MDEESGLFLELSNRQILPVGQGFYELEIMRDGDSFSIRRSPVIAWAIDNTTFELHVITLDGPWDETGECSLRAVETPEGMVIDTMKIRYDNRGEWIDAAKEALRQRENEAKSLSNVVRPKFGDDED